MMTISLCIVARNESAFIRACIESALPVVDEAIVVDTGSTDGTPEIAQRAGARVYRHAWPGDLGQAHDLPISCARGDWILALDGDEIIDPQARHLIPSLVRDGAHDAYRLPIRNYSFTPEFKMRPVDAADPLTLGARCYHPTAVVRLHRRRPAYRNEGRLHQHIEPSIIACGDTVGDAPVPIHHYGLLRLDRDKSPLYRILARLQVADTPDDGRVWLDFGMLFVGQRLPAALDVFQRAYAHGFHGPAAFMAGRVLIEMDRPGEAIRWLRRAVKHNPDDTSVHYDRADAWEAMGSAFEGMGRKRPAERALREALRLRATSPAAANNLAGLLIDRGALDDAERVLQPAVDRFPGLSMPWATLGVLRLRQGAVEAARRALETALDINPANRAAMLNLALVHRAAGRRREAARAAKAAADTTIRDRSAMPVQRPSGSRLRGLRPMPPGGVVSLVPSLHGGAGRVLVDAVRALRGRPQLVLVADPGDYAGQALRSELHAEGVEVRMVADDQEATRAIAQARPECVIDHWGRFFHANGPERAGSERWIAVGHGGFSMPFGYDEYVVLSDFHARFQGHLPAAQVHRIPNGVDLRRFRPRRRRPDRPVTVAVLSRLDPGKLPRQLLAFLPDLRSLGAELLIAGRGPRRHELEPDIRACGLDDVIRFVGAIPSADTFAFLAAADIGLHLTETEQEVCSMTVLEMLASGLPIVSQPRGCLPEMVTSGSNGYLADDPAEIAACLETLIRSARLRRRMGKASRRASVPFGMGRYRARMRTLVDRARRSTRPPLPSGPPPGSEPISLEGWRPKRTYFVCGAPHAAVDRLCEALMLTGIAGFPEPLRIAASGDEWSADPAAFLRRLEWQLEDRTTPNGICGARVSREDLDVLAGRYARPGSDAPFAALTSLLPGLRFIRVVTRPTAARSAHGDGWDSFFARWPEPPVTVSRGRLMARPAAAVRAVLRQLAPPVPRHRDTRARPGQTSLRSPDEPVPVRTGSTAQSATRVRRRTA